MRLGQPLAQGTDRISKQELERQVLTCAPAPGDSQQSVSGWGRHSRTQLVLAVSARGCAPCPRWLSSREHRPGLRDEWGGVGVVQPPWERVRQSPSPAANSGAETLTQTTLGTVGTWFLSNSSMACVTPSR